MTTPNKRTSVPSVDSIVRRPVVGWIGDSADWIETEVELCDLAGISATHIQFGLMREFLAAPRRCDVIVLDVGEIGRMNTTMPRVCDYCSEIVLVSAMTLASTWVVIEMAQESFPDMKFRYAGTNPEDVLCELLA